MENIIKEDRETIIYRGKKYHRHPNSPRLQHRKYFWRHDKWKEPPFPLHRQIWIDNFGEIEEGFVIHHKDGNSLNNNINNLEKIQNSEHTRSHMLKPERRRLSSETAKNQGDRLFKDGMKWRKTEEGKIFLKQNVYTSIFKNKRKVICKTCKIEFETNHPLKSFCSNKCANKHWNTIYRNKIKWQRKQKNQRLKIL